MIAQLILILYLRSGGDPIREPEVREMCWTLLGKARLGFAHDEHAAFVVRSDSGSLYFVEWPSNGMIDSARWDGPLPRGAVAIIHTHPNWLPMPSALDARTAARAHLPVYVITRLQITRTDGASPQVVVEGDWKPDQTLRARDS